MKGKMLFGKVNEMGAGQVIESQPQVSLNVRMGLVRFANAKKKQPYY